MWTAVAGITALLLAVFTWWISPQQTKARLEKELKEIRRKIQEKTNESDKALLAHNGDLLTQLDAELKQLRQYEADILQRLAKNFPNR